VLQVEKSLENWEAKDSEVDCMRLRPLIGMVTSLNKDGGFINQNTFFPGRTLGEGTGTPDFLFLCRTLLPHYLHCYWSIIKSVY